MELTIALGQMDVQLGEPERNWQTVVAMAQDAAARRADVLVLPELWSTGYDLENAAAYATPTDQGIFARVAALSLECQRERALAQTPPDEARAAACDEQLCRQAYGEKVDFNELLDQGFAALPIPDAPFAQGNFPTASGKCEFFSAALAASGQDGLPNHVPNYETLGQSAPYPLAMISPPARNFLNSTFVNVASLQKQEGRPLVEIHPQDAAARGIADGAVVRVFNDRGNYVCHAVLTDRARPGVVNGLGIWWRKLGLAGTNVNQLTSQALTDMGQAPTFYDCLVEVEAATAESITINK